VGTGADIIGADESAGPEGVGLESDADYKNPASPGSDRVGKVNPSCVIHSIAPQLPTCLWVERGHKEVALREWTACRPGSEHSITVLDQGTDLARWIR
jgi:hypothetical protein